MQRFQWRELSGCPSRTRTGRRRAQPSSPTIFPLMTSANRKAIAFLCMGLVLFAAFTPAAIAHIGPVILEAVWIAFVLPSPTFSLPVVVRVDEQTSPLV